MVRIIAVPFGPLVVETTAKRYRWGIFKLKILLGRRRSLLLLEDFLGDLSFRHDNFVAAVKLRQHDPCREDADDQNAEVDANADKVVCVALRLHTVKVVSKLFFIMHVVKVTYAQATVCPSASKPRRIPVWWEREDRSVAYCPTSQ